MRLFITSLLFAVAVAPSADAGSDSLAVRAYTDGLGASVLLTNHGFGVGALLRTGVGAHTSLFIEASVGAGKDEREQEFFTGPFGETVTPFKRNYFLMLPVTVGIEQRLWAETIEDDFRPFIQIGAGPAVGYQWPYFDDLNGNGVRDADEPRRGAFNLSGGEFRFGAAGLAAFGAYFGGEGGGGVGLRIGYAAQYFVRPVDLLEERPQIDRPSRHFFGTPLVTLHFFGF